uniref:Uncharacterized protein n=1 Tax=Arundo donax TaxID=35708 RepID=A0A0A9CY41_ARUDO
MVFQFILYGACKSSSPSPKKVRGLLLSYPHSCLTFQSTPLFLCSSFFVFKPLSYGTAPAIKDSLGILCDQCVMVSYIVLLPVHNCTLG